MDEFEQIIRKNGARPDRLLEKYSNLRTIPAERVFAYAGQWYPFSKSFGLLISTFFALVVEKIRTSDSDLPDLEQLAQRLAFIAVDDLGLFRGSEGGMQKDKFHSRMYLEVCEKLGDVRGHKLEPETKKVLRQSEELCRNYPGGLSAIRIVEGIAHSVMEHQLPLFLAAERDGKKVYKKDELGYINLHLEIEGEHAQESTELIGMYLQMGGDEELVQKQVDEFSLAFGNYWKMMERITHV